MNTKSCVTSLLNPCGKSERIGLYEKVWPDTLRKWLEEGYPAGIDPQDLFNFDICRIGQTFDTYPLTGEPELIETNDDWSIFRNGAGASLKYWNNKSGTPEHVGFRMTSPEIWQQEYRPYLLKLNPMRFRLDESRKEYARLRETGKWICFNSFFVWETMRESMGDLCMYESLALTPEWIHDFNEVYTNFFIQHYAYLFEHVGLPDGVWLSEDLGYKNGLFCSVEMLNELFKPYYKRIVDYFHSLGLKVIIHSCGNIAQALPFFVDIGFDALHPMEIKAGCDPLAFAEQYGDKLALIGGLDVRILESGDKPYIRNQIEKLIKGMKERGARYFFASDHSISTLVSYESYKYALDVYYDNKYY